MLSRLQPHVMWLTVVIGLDMQQPSQTVCCQCAREAMAGPCCTISKQLQRLSPRKEVPGMQLGLPWPWNECSLGYLGKLCYSLLLVIMGQQDVQRSQVVLRQAATILLPQLCLYRNQHMMEQWPPTQLSCLTRCAPGNLSGMCCKDQTAAAGMEIPV